MRATRWHLASVFFVSMLSLTAIPAALASDEVNVTGGLTAAGAPLALHGHDPVGYFEAAAPTPGTAKYATVHEGATYYFASQSNLDTFRSDPERYAPAFGGYCAFGVSVGKKFDGDPRYWTIVEDRLYLNLNEDISRQFAKDVPGNLAKAERHWRRIEHAAVAEL